MTQSPGLHGYGCVWFRNFRHVDARADVRYSYRCGPVRFGQATFTSLVDPCFDRTPLAVGGTASGTLAFDVSRCAINGAAADRYSLATGTGAVDITLTSTDFDALINVWNAAGSTLYAVTTMPPARPQTRPWG